MGKYLRLFRIKHYLKNFLIFLPLFFSNNLFNIDMLIKVIIGFFVFCLVASCIYILNDVMDIEQDKKHPQKKFRPLASGEISKVKAKVILLIMSIFIIIIQFLSWYFKIYDTKIALLSSLILGIYFIINILYSKFLKYLPIIDIIILAFGFVLRVIYGGVIISVDISSWLYLTILSISLCMALGKRKGEFRQTNDKSRIVLKYYTIEFLDKFIYVFLNSAIIFYSLWCAMAFSNSERLNYLMFSIIFVIFIVMRYSLDLENENNSGDPIDIIYSDKALLLSALFYAIYMGGVIYA